MPYGDQEDYAEREPIFGESIIQGLGENCIAGFNVPLLGVAVGGYRGTIVQLTPGGDPVTVKVTWQWDDLATTHRASTTKIAPAGDPTALIFQNLGDELHSIRLTGGDGSTDYAVAPTNQLPLPASAVKVFAPGFPIDVPLFTSPNGPTEGANWTTVIVDNRVRYNAFLVNAGNVGDWIAPLVSLGPKGSIWGIYCSYAVAPDAGNFTLSMASVPEPDPLRGGDDDLGTLTEPGGITYIGASTPIHTYAAAFADTSHNGPLRTLRLMGEDNQAMSFIGPTTDPFTGVRLTDGGAGAYRLKLEVTGKDAASTDYKVRLTSLVARRLDDFSEF